jgi:uncharacterized protein YdiU (UPF0061 family)
MHYLEFPTRSLSLMLSGDQVLRDVCITEIQLMKKVLLFVEWRHRLFVLEVSKYLHRKDYTNLKLLADLQSKSFSNIKEEGRNILRFFAKLHKPQKMIIQWQRVGFVHGDTDNMSIHGITIDYGPCSWLEDYNAGWTPNTTDNQHYVWQPT